MIIHKSSVIVMRVFLIRFEQSTGIPMTSRCFLTSLESQVSLHASILNSDTKSRIVMTLHTAVTCVAFRNPALRFRQ